MWVLFTAVERVAVIAEQWAVRVRKEGKTLTERGKSSASWMGRKPTGKSASGEIVGRSLEM